MVSLIPWTLVGIDVIDLEDPLLKSRKRAFRFITHPKDTYPETNLSFWLLWTAKEAIFKAKRTLSSFSPKEIQVNICQSASKFTFTSDSITGEILIEKKKIVAIAKGHSTSAVRYEVLPSKTGDQSREIREYVNLHFLKNNCLDAKVCPDADGLPVIDYHNLPISLSHHGKLMAFAYPELSC